jgi:alpha-galactosidase
VCRIQKVVRNLISQIAKQHSTGSQRPTIMKSWSLPAIVLLVANSASAQNSLELQTLDLSHMRQGWGEPQVDRGIRERPLAIAGEKFAHGVGTHATSVLWIRLDGQADRFQASVGVDDAASGPATVVFRIVADGKQLWTSGVMKPNDKAKEIDLNLGGVKQLVLLVDDAGDGIAYDHADWANARFAYHGQSPRAIDAPGEEAALLTPPPGLAPEIHGPKVYACGPQHPFLYRIPATGRRPMAFSADGLPTGLSLAAGTGILRGTIAEKGVYRVTLHAKNERGHADRPLKIICGDTLALTPPMGWNSWYIHYNRVTEVHLREAAKQMIASGMADYGYQYVNIDDCWMKKEGDKPYRDNQGAVLPNAKFPNIKGMIDEIHAAGLKAGVYTSPGPWTCGGYVGAYQHEAADARKFAQWGFDFLKYDWCSYGDVAGGKDLAHLKKPYQLLAAELKKQDRDIVLNLCQYGMGDVWKWGGEVGQCWRTTGDLGLERGGRLPGFYGIGLSNARHWENARPGCWNDPDYLLIGYVGDAQQMGVGRKTTLTPNEQYSYMSMWCLMASPLIFSGDMARLDPFTLNVMCNAEVIDVDQDALGRQARILRKTDGEFILAKDMEDGSTVLGLFNLGETEAKIAVTWAELGLTGAQRVRDLWRQKDLLSTMGRLEAPVARHGVALVRLLPEK